MGKLYREIGSYTAPVEKSKKLYRDIGGNANDINGGEYLGGKLASGVASIGIGAYNLIVGGYYQLTGNTYAAQKLYAENDPQALSKKLDSQYKANGFMSFMGSVAEGVGQFIPTAVLSLIPGVGTAVGTGLSFAGHTGMSVGDAFAKTGSLGAREYIYGAAMGTMESALELIGGKVGGWIGGSKLGTSAVNLSKGATKGITTAAAKGGKLALARTTGQIVKGGATEFAEEFIEAYAEAGLQRMLSIDPNATVSFKEALYAGAVGFASGGVMSGAASILNTPGMKHVGKRVMNAGEVDVTISAATEIASAFKSNGNHEAAVLKSLQDNLQLWELTADKTGGQAQMILGNIELAMNVVAATAAQQGTVKKVTANPEKFLPYAKALFGEGVTIDDLKNADSRIVRFIAASNWATGEGDALAIRAKQQMFRTAVEQDRTGTPMQDLKMGTYTGFQGGEQVFRAEDGDYVFVSQNKNGSYTVMKGPDMDNLTAYGKEGPAQYGADGDISAALLDEGEVNYALGHVMANAKEVVKQRAKAQTKLSLENGESTIEISDDSELAQLLKANADKNPHEIIKSYLVTHFGGQTFTLSDGRQAIMDKRDADKLSVHTDKRSVAQVSGLREMVERARYDHSAHNVEHKKFKDFHYYVAKIKYGKKEYEIWLNIGTAKNNGTNHIYDIRDKKEEAPTPKDVSRPEGNAIRSASPTDSIPENGETVKGESKKYSLDAEAQKGTEKGSGQEAATDGGENAETAAGENYASENGKEAPKAHTLSDSTKRLRERVIDSYGAEVQDRARKLYGKKVDQLSADRRIAIYEAIESGQNVDKDTLAAACYFLAKRPGLYLYFGQDLNEVIEETEGEQGKKAKARKNGLHKVWDKGHARLVAIDGNAKGLRKAMVHEVFHDLASTKTGLKLLCKVLDVAHVTRLYETAKLYGAHYASTKGDRGVISFEQFFTDGKYDKESRESVLEAINAYQERFGDVIGKNIIAEELAAEVVAGRLDSKRFMKMAKDTGAKGLILRGLRRMISYLRAKKEAKPMLLEAIRFENLYLDALEQRGEYEQGTKLSMDGGQKKIAPGMSDEERYEVLRDRKIENVPSAKPLPSNSAISDWEDINTLLGKEKRALIRKIATEFKVLGREYSNQDIELSFEFSANNFEESYSKQKRNYVEFAKMFSVFDDVIQKAVGIEVHLREGYKTDPTLENMFVLLSAYRDGEYAVPVKLEVKKFKDKVNRLYVAISLDKIKMTEVSEQGTTENGVAQDSRSVTISISKMFKKINPRDESFYKYIPKPFLTDANADENSGDTRYSLDFEYLSEDEHELVPPRTSEGQKQKTVAHHTRAKSYKRMEAADVIKVMFSSERFGEKGSILSMKGASKKAITDYLWLQMNTTDPTKFDEIAERVADFMIRHTTLQEAFITPSDEIRFENARQALDVIARYKGKINISEQARAELIYRFGGKNGRKEGDGDRLSDYWHQKDGKGMSVEMAAETIEAEIRAAGGACDIVADTEQDTIYNLALYYGKVLRDMEDYRTFMQKTSMEAESEADVSAYRAEIKEKIMDALREKGTESKYHKVVQFYERENERLRDKLYETNKKYEGAVKRQYTAADAVFLAREVGEMVTKRKYLNAAELVTPEMESVGRVLASVATPRKIKKKQVREAMGLLAQWYTPQNIDGDSAVTADDGTVSEAAHGSLFHPDIKEKMERLAAGGKNAQLTYEELRDLAQVLAAVRRVIQSYGMVELNGKRQQAAELATGEVSVLSEYLAQGEGKEGKGFFASIFHNAGQAIGKKLKNNFLYKVMTPRQVIQSLEWYDKDGVLTKAYADIQNGVASAGSDYADMMRPVMEFFDSHKKYEKRLSKSYITYEGEEMSIGQAISLYMTTKREQAALGFAEAGFRYMGKDGKVKQGKARDAEAIRNEIGAALSADDKAYIKVIEGVFERAREMKVQTDMAIFAYTNVEDGYYFPIARDQMEIARKVSDIRATLREMAVVGNKSFNKNTVKGAKNALFISDVTMVTEAHAMGVAQYAGLYMPLSTWDRLWNKKVDDGKGNMVSVRQLVNDRIWTGKNKRDIADDFFRQLFADIQGVRTERRVGDDIYASIRSTYVSAALGFNLSSILKQLGSFPSACVYLSAVDLAKGLGMNFKTDRTEMWKYSKVANGRMFDKGRFVEQGANTKLESVSKGVRKFGEMTMAGVEGMDNWVVGRLWNACQQNVARTKGLAVGTEQNKLEAGKLLDTVINETQSTSTADTRSAMQRGNLFAQTFSMFTSDAVKQVSYLFEGAARLYSARLRRKMGKGSDAEVKAAGKFFARSVAAFTASTALVVAIAQFIKWLLGREREEGETVAEDVTQEVFGQVLGIIPLVGDLYDKFFNNYDVGSFVFDNINDLADGVIALFDSVGKAAKGEVVTKQDFTKPFRTVLYQISSMYGGVPLRNIYNYTTGVVKKISPKAGYSIDTLFEKPSYTADIAKAIERGDEELAQYILELSIKERMGKGEYDSAVAAELLNLTMNGFADPNDSVAPLKIPASVDGVAVTAAQHKQMQTIYNKSSKALYEMVQSEQYLALSDEEKLDAINRTYRTYLSYAKAEVMGTEDGKRTAAVWVSPLLSGESNAILARISAMENTETATRAEQVTAYLNSLDLENDERYLLLFAAGYRSATVLKKVRGIVAVSDMSDENKAAFEKQYFED